MSIKTKIYINYILSFLIYFIGLSICVAIVSWFLSGGETFNHGIPLLRVAIAIFLTYRNRLRILAEW